MTTNQTPTPDETVTRLAEAMAGVTKRRGGHGNPACYMQSAEDALQAIAAQPDILRSMGLGRLLTWNEFVDVILPGPVGDETSVPAGAAAERMRDAGFLRPDPEPPAPELPSVREQVAAMIQDGMDNGQYPDAIMRSLFAEFDITTKAPRP